MRFLITGGAGFLGSHLTDAMLGQGHEVTILDVASDLKVRHQLGNPQFRYVRDSILNREILEGLISWCWRFIRRRCLFHETKPMA